MKKYVTLIGTTAITAILLFAFGFFISPLILEMITTILGIELYTYSVTALFRFSISMGILFGLCSLSALVVYLVHSSTQTALFSVVRYFIFLVVSIISILAGMSLRVVYLARILPEIADPPLGPVGISLESIHFLGWGIIVNLCVCGVIIVFLLISRPK